MDLSWCIICDRHCVEENLYCSETCRIQDVNDKHSKACSSTSNSPLSSPPASPLLDPFFSSFNHERRTSITISKSTRVHHGAYSYVSPSSVPRYSLSE
ncbi:hypothetical protein [Parasitella parasitica]|uniref:Uncharacterized protein n=1 Tax=Parasitella parasitica TaxID=35722 RepID=A0A0B7NUT9_9FUNG|nr:hypothetical protein [Parasitella parasitica]